MKEWQQLSKEEQREWEIKIENASMARWRETGEWTGEDWMVHYSAKRAYMKHAKSVTRS